MELDTFSDRKYPPGRKPKFSKYLLLCCQEDGVNIFLVSYGSSFGSYVTWVGILAVNQPFSF